MGKQLIIHVYDRHQILVLHLTYIEYISINVSETGARILVFLTRLDALIITGLFNIFIIGI